MYHGDRLAEGRGDQRGATGDRTEDQVEEVGLMRTDHEKTAMLSK